MTLQNSALGWGGALIAASLALSLFAAPAASAETADLFTISGVKLDGSAASTNAARDLAMAQGRTLAWSELFRRLTAQDQWGQQPKLTDNELSRLISLSEVRNERHNSNRYLAEATFHFSAAEVSKLLRGSNSGSTEPLDSSPMIAITTLSSGLPDGVTEANELKILPPIDKGIRASLTADVRFNSLENWARIRAQSALVTGIAGLDVIGLSPHEAEVDLTYFGPIEDLPQAMARQNLKLSDSAGHYTLELENAATVADEPAETLGVPLVTRLLRATYPIAAAQQGGH
jgi:hypothetical protein